MNKVTMKTQSKIWEGDGYTTLYGRKCSLFQHKIEVYDGEELQVFLVKWNKFTRQEYRVDVTNLFDECEIQDLMDEIGE